MQTDGVTVGSVHRFFLRCDLLHIVHHTLNKGVSIQSFGVYDLSVYNSALSQTLTNGNAVDIVQSIILFGSIELLGLDKLRDSALYLRPRKLNAVGASATGNEQAFAVAAAILAREPRRSILISGVFFHIPDHGAFTGDISVPTAERIIDVLLRDRARLIVGRSFAHSFHYGDICSRFSGVYWFGGYFLGFGDNGHRIGRMLVNDAVQRRDRDRIRLAQLLHKLFQSVGRNTAHFNAAYAQHSSGSQRKIKCSGCGLCIFTIHLKEVANLEQNDIVGVIVLDIVVGVQLLSELPFPCLHFVVPSLLFGSEISAGSDDVIKPRRNLIPVEFYGSAERLLQLHALAAVIFRTAAGYCMGTATGSVLVFQKIYFLFGVVGLGEIGINTAFATLHIPAACQSGVNFIFGDEHSQGGNFGHIRLIFAPRQSQIGKFLADDGNLVVVETHEVTVFSVRREKVRVFAADFLQKIGVFQSLRKPRSCIGETASAVVVERFQ